MTTTTNFKKWAGFLLLTSIFLLSGTTNIKAADSPPPTEICITPGAKTFDFLLPSVPDCDRSNVSPSWTCNIKNGSVRINGKNVEIDGIDTSLTYIFTGCCNIEGIDYCSEISYHFNYGFDPYDGPSNYSVCIGEGGVNFSGILCEVPVFTLPSGFSRSGNRINFNASVGTGIYTIEICCGACCETFTISITNGPDAGPDQQLCGIPFSVELGAANPGDSWSFLNGPDYATVDVNSGSATLGAAYGIYCFELTTKGGECKDQVCITVCDPLNLPNIIACDGVATVYTSANVTYNILSGPNTPLYGGNNFGMLIPGVYTIEAINEDCRICTSTFTITVNPITTSGNLSSTTCGLNNGQVTLGNVSGGNGGPYTFDWSHLPGANDPQSVSGLAAGNYTQIITDALGCSKSFSYTIGASTGITSATGRIDNTTCGNNNGAIDLTIIGGTAPFSYIWSNGATTQDISGLVGGSYTVTVTDANNCPASYSGTVGSSSAISASNAIINSKCGLANGEVGIYNVSGGTAPYSYDWSHIGGTNNPQSVSGLAAGTYTLIISDAGGCSSSFSYTIGASTGITNVTGSVTHTTCGNSNGSIDITVSGGTAPYSYNWSNGATTQDISGLAANGYSVTVTDANNCTATYFGNVNSSTDISISGNITHTTCGRADGAIDVTISGGTAPLTINWSPGVGIHSEDRTNLTSGNHTIFVTDASGCTASQTFTVNPSSTPIPTPTITNTSCGLSNGAINWSISGGITPYTYLWNDGNTNRDRTNLPAGSYTFAVTDALNCTFNYTVGLFISSSSPLLLSYKV